MKILLYISNLIIPLIIFYIVISGFFAKTDVYGEFTKGIKEGFQIVVGIAPTIVALFVAVGVMRAGGALDFIGEQLKPVAQFFSFPAEVIPLALVRMFSSSAANGLLVDIYKKCGTDSFAGLTASIMMSCTETIFYTMSIYFGAVKIKKTRYTLAGALLASFAGLVASVLLAGYIR